MKYLPSVLFLFAALALAGCPATEPSGVNVPDTQGDHDHVDGDHDHGDSDKDHGEHGKVDMEKVKEVFAKMPPEDAESAEKQKICPVGGEMLGTMGTPVKVDVNGQQVWICCENCKESLLEKPDEYLAKLKK